MTTDLWALLGAALLQWLQIMAAATPQILMHGLPWAFGARDAAGEADLPPWATRLQRASANLQENLVLFAIVVLVVHVAGKANDTSATGALVFLVARALYVPTYAAGVPYVRTTLWAISVAGMGMVASALL